MFYSRSPYALLLESSSSNILSCSWP